MEIISFIGIVAALILIILGSVRGYSLILLSTVAALLVAATGGVNVFENYANVYMGGVANMVLALFPIFLGGQMFGKMLEMSGLPMAVASGVFRKLGPASAVAAVYLATLAMSVGGIDVFVIIFTMYPLAAAFFKAAGISRSLIPACVLGGAVAMQTLPGMPINNIVLPANAFGTTPMAGFWMAIAGFAIVGGGNLWYLHRAGQKYIAKGEGFIPREGDTDDVDLNTEGLPNPFLLLIPMYRGPSAQPDPLARLGGPVYRLCCAGTDVLEAIRGLPQDCQYDGRGSEELSVCDPDCRYLRPGLCGGRGARLQPAAGPAGKGLFWQPIHHAVCVHRGDRWLYGQRHRRPGLCPGQFYGQAGSYGRQSGGVDPDRQHLPDHL